MGYEARERKLRVKPDEVEVVRHIFRRYLALGNISKLARDLAERGYRTRKYTSKSGRVTGEREFSRGHLHRILRNRIYLGEIVHAGQAYPGEHQAIIDEDLWQRAQQILDGNRSGMSGGERSSAPSPLGGLIYDDRDNRMSASASGKNGRCHRYYVSQALVKGRREQAGSVGRVPAYEVEKLVAESVGSWLGEVAGRGSEPAGAAEAASDQLVRQWVRKVVVAKDRIRITLGVARHHELNTPVPNSSSLAHSRATELEIPFRLIRNGGGTRIVAEGGQALIRSRKDPKLIRAVARAHAWRQQLVSGKACSIAELAERAKVTRPYVSRILRLAFLAPDLTEAILDGRQPQGLTVERLRDPIPYDWAEQRRLFGNPTSAA